MNKTAFGSAFERTGVRHHRVATENVQWQTKFAAFLALVLVLAPRTRIVVIAPIYLVDVLALILLIFPLHSPRHRWLPREPFSRIIIVYLLFITVSELRGMFAYATPLESLYMMGQYAIAISVFFTLPRLVSGQRDISLVLKGILLGTLISASIVIMYSVGPLRPLVVDTIYTSSFLNPGWESLIRAIEIYGAGEAAMRGRSLVGAATLTAGFLATVWPLSFLAYRRFSNNVLWKRVALATSIIAPLGILATYGRGAWAIVISIVGLIAIFGLASARRIVLMALATGVIIFTQFQIDPKLTYVERVVIETQKTLESPFADLSTAERLLSYVEPFEHLAENPVWWLAGAGRSSSRSMTREEFRDIGGQLYDEGGRATHSAFAMSYYSFGFVAAICQILLIFIGFIFILKRLRVGHLFGKDQRLVWQSLFMAWWCMTLWWGSGHAIVGEARGTMLMFFMYGLLVAFEKLRVMQLAGKRSNPASAGGN